VKPIIFFDIESTGTDVAKDRIITLAAKKISSLSGFVEGELSISVNPGIRIPAEATECHGIKNEDVANFPLFQKVSNTVFGFFKDCDLAGFNLLNFDIPILWEELHRAGIDWDLETSKTRVIDVGNIFKKKEPRTLVAAVGFYCGREHNGAHNAMADVDATLDVFLVQRQRYPDIEKIEPSFDDETIAHDTVSALSKFSLMDDRIDLAGKLVRDADGDAVYAIGKSKGVKVKDDPSFAYWMLGRDFSAQTKMVLNRLLKDLERREGLV
jgi:DNA polymerase-3 subunit epsilon